jgi:hypothetical protein
MVEESRQIIDKAAQEGVRVMVELVPKERGRAGGTASRIHAKAPIWHAGGAGGGGYWEAHAVVEEENVGTERSLADLIVRGTGIHGPFGSPVIGRAGNVMAFEAGGKTLFRRSVKGMEPQREWIDAGEEAARDEAQKGVFRFDPFRKIFI